VDLEQLYGEQSSSQNSGQYTSVDSKLVSSRIGPGSADESRNYCFLAFANVIEVAFNQAKTIEVVECD
jgi:hypothetical protein